MLVEGSELGDRSCEIRAEGSELWDRSCEVRGEGLGLGAMGSELWAVWGKGCVIGALE